MNASVIEAQVKQYELEISIESSAENVWDALINQTDAWWLPDFHMVDPNSTVTFDAKAGGGLVEHFDGAGSLLWYTVQYYQPGEFTIYLVGSIAPDWGGPATTHLKLQVVPETENTCTFQVSDALFGRVDDGTANSLQSGWNQLFSDGLKAHVESA